MILKKNANFRNNRRFIEDSAVFEGMKSHDAGAGGTKVWYQNDRKDVNYISLLKVRLRELGAKPKG